MYGCGHQWGGAARLGTHVLGTDGPAKGRPLGSDMGWMEAKAGRSWRSPCFFRDFKAEPVCWTAVISGGCKQLDDCLKLLGLSSSALLLSPCHVWASCIPTGPHFPCTELIYSLGINLTVNALDSQVWESWRHKQQKPSCSRGREYVFPLVSISYSTCSFDDFVAGDVS